MQSGVSSALRTLLASLASELQDDGAEAAAAFIEAAVRPRRADNGLECSLEKCQAGTK